LNKASNDSEFRRSVSRACPLRTTFTRIEGQPSTLILYKIKASSYWQCRFFHGGKMIVKSTREKQLEDAKRFAVALYQTHTSSSGSNQGLDGQSGEQSYFKNIAAQMLSREAARRDRGELADLSYRADKTRLETEIIPFFGDLSIASITEQQIQSFYSKIESRRLSSTTLSLYLMTLRKVLKYARTSNLIQSVPIIPSVKIRKRSRGSFTPTEYVRLIRSARRLIGTPVLSTDESIPKRFWIIPKYRHYPSDLADVIAFMVNSFIRPSDLRTLRHRHVEIVRGQHNYLRLTLPETKAHDAPIVTLRPAVRLYEHLVIRQKREGFGNADDFLFLPGEQNRKYVLGVFGWMFRNLLERLGLRDGPHGHPRTLYSLRHTAITLRLLYGTGIDMLTLARNARTSVEMIERHYASALTAERNIGMLQSKRNPKERN
jgi:hypothetical protein